MFIFQHQFTDGFRKFLALPLTLGITGLIAVLFRRGGTCGANRIRGRPKFVIGHVSGSHCVSGGTGSIPGRTIDGFDRIMGGKGSFSSFSNGNLTARPGSGLLDGVFHAFVLWAFCAEQMENMLCTICCPGGQHAVTGVIQQPAAAYGYEMWVSTPKTSFFFSHWNTP